jgi:hypothetical protein
MFTDHRNRFIPFWLHSGVRLIIALFALIPAQAISLKDFNARPGKDQAVYVVDTIEKISNRIAAHTPRLAQDIRDWYSRKPEGKPISAGMERLYVELAAVEIQAKDGLADLSKIQIEAVILRLVKQKFPTAEWWLSFQR